MIERAGENFYQRYLSSDRDQPQSWEALHHAMVQDQSQVFSKNLTVVDSLTPFAGHALSLSFTKEQKEKLFNHFVIFMSEAVALLEQLFLVSVRAFLREKGLSTRTQSKQVEHSLPEAARKMMREEFNHLKHFKAFLKHTPALDWPRESLFLKRQHTLRRWLMGLIKWEPLCVLMPAAKLEIFSMTYSKILIKHAPQNEVWTELNRLHVLDEVHHIPLDYEWTEIEVGNYSFFRKVKWTFATLLFVLVMQLVILSAWSRVMSKGLQVRSLALKVLWGLRGIKWGVCDFVASLETKQKVRQHFSNKTIPSKFILSFMQW